jgi:hypothetical protein
MNNTALILKDGKVYAFNMPENPKHDVKCHSRMACICASLAFENGANRDVVDGYDNNCPHKYNKAVEQAISSAVECNNQEQAEDIIYRHKKNLLPIMHDHPYVIPGLTVSYDTVVPCKAKRDCQEPTNNDDGTITKCISNCKHEYRVALLSLQEKTETCQKCRTTDFKSCHSMRCPMREEVEEKTEKQELTDSEWYEFLYDIGSQIRFLKGETGPDEWEKMQAFIESKYTISFKKKVKS